MAISSVSSTTTTATANTSGSGAMIASNFNSFLQLLTTQLQNQNPLDPMDTNQFTQQLVQFAGVEQQIQTNDTLTALLATSDTTRLSGAVQFIGKQVVAEGATTLLDDQNANWLINVPKDAPQSTVVIKDADGNEVYSQAVELKSGDQVFTWNGQNSNGIPVENGFYTITVVGRDAAGGTVAATTDIQGTVSGVELEDGEPVLNVGTIRVKMSSVKSIVQVAAPPPDDSES